MSRPLRPSPSPAPISLASLTTLTFDGSTLVDLHYTEPAADLIDETTASVGA